MLRRVFPHVDGRRFRRLPDHQPGDLAGPGPLVRSVRDEFWRYAPRAPLHQPNPAVFSRPPHLPGHGHALYARPAKVLTSEQAGALGVGAGYASDAADAVLMATRGGNRYTRLFMEALIRPGNDLGNWASRAGLTALGIVPTGPAEISLYKQAHYAQASAHLIRYALRTDGFVSVNAPYRGGEMVTKPLVFQGHQLAINFATSAAGGLRVELQDAAGKPLSGYGLGDAVEQVGDDIERTVTWKTGSELAPLAGTPVRVRFVMTDADLFSLRFR